MQAKDERFTQIINGTKQFVIPVYNSKYSDKPFHEKNTIKDGFKDSSVRLNRFISEQPQWTAQEMETRSANLAERALAIWPKLDASKTDVDAAQHAELAARARGRSLEQVPLSDSARALLAQLRPALLELSDSIVEVPESKTVSYYEKHDFFMEILPRQHRLLLLLDLAHADCEYLDENTHDATEWRFMFYAQHSGGVAYRLSDASEIESAMKLVRQAWQQARS
jgi:predicted transport protein